MSKFNPTPIANLQNENTVINSINNNFEEVESVIENLLSRDGTSPNEMNVDLDMNSNRILNLPEADSNTEPVRKLEFDATIANLTASGIQLPTSGIITYDHENIITYTREIETDTNGITIIDGDGVAGNPIISLTGNILALANLTSADGKLPYFTGADTAALTDFTSYARTLLDDSDAATARATLGLVIGTDVQAYDTELAALAGLTSASNKLPYFTGSGTASTTDFTSFARTLVDDNDASTARSTLGLTIGTDVQAYDTELAAIAGLTSAADRLPYFTGSGTASLATFTSAGRALVDAATASDQLTTLGFSTYGKTLIDDADASAAQTTLGISTYIKTLLDDTDASTAQTTLGISTFVKTILDDADAAAVRTTIGAQQSDAELTALAGLTSAADALPYFTGTGTAATTTLTSAARSVLDDASTSDMRTTLGLAIGTNVQAYDANLAVLAALTPTKGNLLVGNGTAWTSLGVGTDSYVLTADSAQTTGLTWAAGGGGGGGGAPTTASYLTLGTDAGLANERVFTAGTGIGVTDGGAGSTYTVAINDAELLAIAGLTSAADQVPYFTGSGTASLMTVTSTARTILDDTSVGAIRTTLGVGTSDNPQFATIELGNASDTTISRTGAGVVAIEGAQIAVLSVENQPLTGGVTVTSKSLGTQTTGTLTLDVGDRPLQHYTNGGAHTLAPGSVIGSSIIEITNNGSAGSITTSGFTKVSGDSFTTTNAHKFLCTVVVSNSYSLLQVQALQ